MTADDATTVARFPMRFLTVTVILTGIVLAWLGWNTYRSYQITRTSKVVDVRIEKLRGTILHLDEVLTMSARMAAATGDLRWEKRYRQYEPKLDAAIKEAIQLAPGARSGEQAAKTETANVRLVDMENRVFKLIREGRQEEARSILSSTEYNQQKQVYAEGMARLDELLAATAEATLRAEQRRTFLGIAFAGIVIPGLLLGWIVVLRTMRHWRATLLANTNKLAQQAGELTELNRALDHKVAERTKELRASEATALRRFDEAEAARIAAEAARITAERANRAVDKERQLLRQLLTLQERDRKLIAYEIHDGLTQQLAGALFLFESARELQATQADESRGTFDAGVKLLRESITEARKLIGDLRPPILDESGVVAAIDYLVGESRDQGGPEIEYSHSEQFDRMPPPLESAVFRIVRESLINARRHSGSDKVRIRLSRKNGLVRVEVEDWGVGFDVKQVADDRFGLKGIRERARLLGGHSIIDSALGKGTRIIVELPLVETPG